MIMIPKESRVLLVGVVVIFELSGRRHVFCPAVEGRAGVRTMQMDRVRGCGVVDESDHGLCPAGNHECRPWGYSIIPNQICKTQIGVDRLSEWLNVHFVVLNVLA